MEPRHGRVTEFDGCVDIGDVYWPGCDGGKDKGWYREVLPGISTQQHPGAAFARL